MKRLGIALAALLALTLVSFPALAWIRSPATTFGTLPPGGFPASGPTALPGQVIVFNSHGKLLRQMTLLSGGTGIPDASPHLLGLAFNPVTGDFLVLDFGAGKVLRVNPLTGAVLGVFADIFAKCTSMPGLCPITPSPFPPGFPGLNALTFDSAGNVYISDSFQGIIWRTGPGGSPIVAWVPSNSMLTTAGLTASSCRGTKPTSMC